MAVAISRRWPSLPRSEVACRACAAVACCGTLHSGLGLGGAAPEVTSLGSMAPLPITESGSLKPERSEGFPESGGQGRAVCSPFANGVTAAAARRAGRANARPSRNQWLSGGPRHETFPHHSVPLVLRPAAAARLLARALTPFRWTPTTLFDETDDVLASGCSNLRNSWPRLDSGKRGDDLLSHCEPSLL